MAHVAGLVAVGNPLAVGRGARPVDTWTARRRDERSGGVAKRPLIHALRDTDPLRVVDSRQEVTAIGQHDNLVETAGAYRHD